MKLNCFSAYLLMSDNANLLDMEKNRKVGRFTHYMVAQSAATR